MTYAENEARDAAPVRFTLASGVPITLASGAPITRAYPELKGSDRVREDCGKCGGSGSVSWGVHVTGLVRENGRDRYVPQVCFDCDGVGYRMVLVSSVRARETRQRRAAERAEARAAERRAWAAEREAAEAARQAELEAQRQAEREAAEDVPTGRVVITGELVSIRDEESFYGYSSRIVHKGLVRDDRGFKLWGNLPADLVTALYDRWYAAEKAAVEAEGAEFWTGNYGPSYWQKSARGARVTFTAAVEPSNDDPKFGFWKRPTKSGVL